jgi:hypothetical protein
MLFQRGIFAKAFLLQQRGQYICGWQPKIIKENFLPIKPARYCIVYYRVGVEVSGVLL